MNTTPINLTVRFLLELVMLAILAYWGWHLSPTWFHYAAAVGIPVVIAALWGIFRIQNDPKPAPVEIPGPVRLLFELGLFAWASWALFDIGKADWGKMLALIVIAHYLVSYDRTWAMIRNRPYKGFIKN